MKKGAYNSSSTLFTYLVASLVAGDDMLDDVGGRLHEQDGPLSGDYSGTAVAARRRKHIIRVPHLVISSNNRLRYA